MPLNLPVPEMLASGGLAAVLVKTLDFFAGRQKSKAYTMGAVDHAVQTAMALVTGRLEIVERQHTECEANLREVRSEVDELKRERADQKAEIDRLMGGEVPAYAPAIPKDQS